MGMRPGLSWWEADPLNIESKTTIGDLMDWAAERFPEREAIVSVGEDDLRLEVRWTFSELIDRAAALACGLIDLGLEPGSRVAIWAPNVPEWVVVELAVARAGLVLVPINWTWKAEEIRHVLSHSQARALMFTPTAREADMASELERVRPSLPRLEHVFSLSAPTEGATVVGDLYRRGRRIGSAVLRRRSRATQPEHVAQIQYTSGTTGFPKGVQLTHRGLVTNARLAAERWAVGPDDRWCNPMPLFHTAGSGIVTLGALASGACQLPVAWFDPGHVMRTISTEHATLLESVPTMLARLLDWSDDRRIRPSALRLIGVGGSVTPPALLDRVRATWCTDVRIVYGLTEASPLITQQGLDDPDDTLARTVGRPLPGVDVRVVGVDGVTRTGEPGELQARGYQVMAGYLNAPEATAEVIDDDGWLRTGDTAVIDADGFVSIVGRIKEVIIRGGENIYPAEIEALLGQHEAIADVVVVGVPDPVLGEDLCAVIVPVGAPDLDEIRAWARARISRQKVPRYIVTAPSLPLTATGKVCRSVLGSQVGRLLQTLAEDAEDPGSLSA